MSKYALIVDPELCFGCYTCEVACKQEHNLPVGSRWIQVMTVGPQMKGDRLVMKFVPVTCRHCGKPPCLEACPVDAITKREDGIVLINAELCNGCKACLQACPFGAIQFSNSRNIAEKCDLCAHLVGKGLLPSCVKHCPAQAIYFGETNQIVEKLRQRHAELSVL